VKDGDSVPVNLLDGRYVLQVERLVNLPIGDDYAELLIVPAEGWERARIERLLELVEASGLIFVRNGQDVPAADFAAHLRNKWGASKQPNLTVEQFIEHIASRSISSGEPYRVKHSTGETGPAADWLRGQVADGPPSSAMPATEKTAPPGE
jgi:hypothetical protein